MRSMSLFFEEVLNLGQRHIQRPQIADRVQRLKLFRSIIAVAGKALSFYPFDFPCIINFETIVKSMIKQKFYRKIFKDGRDRGERRGIKKAPPQWAAPVALQGRSSCRQAVR